MLLVFIRLGFFRFLLFRRSYVAHFPSLWRSLLATSLRPVSLTDQMRSPSFFRNPFPSADTASVSFSPSSLIQRLEELCSTRVEEVSPNKLSVLCIKVVVVRKVSLFDSPSRKQAIKQSLVRALPVANATATPPLLLI